MASELYLRRTAAGRKLKRKFNGYSGALTTKLRKKLDERGNVAFGGLRKSIKTRAYLKASTNRYVIEVSLNGYGGYLNRARKGAMPPADLVLLWMIEKGIKPLPNKDGTYPTMRQAAFAIAYSIGKNGFSTYNKNNKVGWIDMVVTEEVKRLKVKTKKAFRVAVRDTVLESLNYLQTK